MTAPKRGDQYVVDGCVSTTGEWLKDVVVTVSRVGSAPCGCTELITRRPGDYAGPLAGPMQLLVDRCAHHRRNNPHGPNGAPEPQRHVVETAEL